MICQKCGKVLPNDSAFCEFCGARVEVILPEPPSTAKPRKNWLLPAIAAVAALALVAVYLRKDKEEPPVNAAPETQQTMQEGGKPFFSLEPETEAPVREEPMTEPMPEITEAELPTEAEPVQTVETSEPSEAPKAAAELLSTTEAANAIEMEWFLDYMLQGGTGAGQVITNPSYSRRLTGQEQALVSGGWKAYMCFIENDVYIPDAERYFNVVLENAGEEMLLTANWKYVYDAASGHSVEETGSDTFRGTWDADNAAASFQSNHGGIEIFDFYYDEANQKEYAVGVYFWPSGEMTSLALMR